jgi:excisionase family DNA binding protein
MIIHGKKYLTINEAAKVIGKTHITVRKWIKGGMLNTYTFGNSKKLILEEDAINLTK